MQQVIATLRCEANEFTAQQLEVLGVAAMHWSEAMVKRDLGAAKRNYNNWVLHSELAGLQSPGLTEGARVDRQAVGRFLIIAQGRRGTFWALILPLICFSTPLGEHADER